MGVIPIAEKIMDGYKFHASDLNGHLAEIRGLAQAIVGELPSPTSSTPATPTPSATPRRLSILNLGPSAGTSPPDLRKGFADLTPVSTNPQSQGTIPPGLIKINSRPSSQHLHIVNFSWPKGTSHTEPSSAPISPLTEMPPDGLPFFSNFRANTPTTTAINTAINAGAVSVNDLHQSRTPMKRATTSTNLAVVKNANPSPTGSMSNISEKHHRRSISQNIVKSPTWGGAQRSESPESMVSRSKSYSVSTPLSQQSSLTLTPSSPDGESSKSKLRRHPSYTFEKLMFRNAVILCDV
jgi:hypothetical protein